MKQPHKKSCFPLPSTTHTRCADGSQPPCQRDITSHYETSRTLCRRVESTAKRVKVGYEYYRKRIHIAVCLQTTPLQRRGDVCHTYSKLPFSESGDSQPSGKRGDRGSSSRWTRERVLKSLFSGSQKRRRAPPYSGPAPTESSSGEALVQDDHLKTNPLANLTGALVRFCRSKRRVLPYPDSPPTQALSEICIRGSCIPVYSPSVWLVPGTTHVYEMYERRSLPSTSERSARSKLSRWLAADGSFREHARCSQGYAYQPPAVFGAFNQFPKKLTPTHAMHFVPGREPRLSLYAGPPAPGTRTYDYEFAHGVPRRKVTTAETFSKSTWPDDSSLGSMLPEYAPHAPPPALAKSTRPSARMAFGIDARAGDSQMSGGDVPLDERCAVQTGRDDGTGEQTQNCHDGRVMQGMGSPLRWQPSLRCLDGHGENVAHKLPGIEGG